MAGGGMRLLDLFCGAGGASMGYARAGFEVVGVDIRPQPGYPFTFICADAMEVDLDGFDIVHASPPCQAYSKAVTSRSSRWNDTRGKDEPALIEPLRERLAGRTYVIENVPGAPLEGFILCGSMFGLDITRHRVFETSFPVTPPAHPPCRGIARAAAERRGWDYRDMTVTGKGRNAGTSQRWMQLLGIESWPGARQRDIKEAIPPAYTEWIGRQLMAEVRK